MLNYNFEYIGFSYLQQNFGDETGFYKEIMLEACTNIPEIVKQLNLDFKKQEWKNLGESAHQLKGVVQIFDLADLEQKLKQLQLDTEKEQNLHSYGEIVAYVDDMCEKVVSELKIACQLL